MSLSQCIECQVVIGDGYNSAHHCSTAVEQAGDSPPADALPIKERIMKYYCTQKTITIDGIDRIFTDTIWAESYEEATLFCNDEYVIGEILKTVDYDEFFVSPGH